MVIIHTVDRSTRLASLDLNLLVVFDAIAKDRSVTAAARRIGLSQPAMSSALARLRKTFNDPLFVRTGGAMQPTPYAQMLTPPIQRACELVASSLEVQASFDPKSADNTFQFYMTDVGEALFLPKILRALSQRAPRIKVKVLRIPEHGEQAAMAAGEVDLAIGFFPDLRAGFFQQRLYVDDFVGVVRIDHPRLKAGSLSARQFAEMPHAVIATAGTGHAAAVEREIAKHRLRVALTIPHFMAVPDIVSQTDHIVIVPRRLVKTLPSFSGVRAIELPIKMSPFEIKQHWHERFHNDHSNRWIRALVAEMFLE
jgi:DNA-binding transcriptional LysR family regulator